MNAWTSQLTKQLKKTSNGITLVALVVTIIIMIILAGVSIATLRNSGILSNSKQAAKDYEIAQEKEILATAVASVISRSAMADEEWTAEQFRTALEEELGKSGIEDVVVTMKENSYIVSVHFGKTNQTYWVDFSTGEISDTEITNDRPINPPVEETDIKLAITFKSNGFTGFEVCINATGNDIDQISSYDIIYRLPTATGEKGTQNTKEIAEKEIAEKNHIFDNKYGGIADVYVIAKDNSGKTLAQSTTQEATNPKYYEISYYDGTNLIKKVEYFKGTNAGLETLNGYSNWQDQNGNTYQKVIELGETRTIDLYGVGKTDSAKFYSGVNGNTEGKGTRTYNSRTGKYEITSAPTPSSISGWNFIGWVETTDKSQMTSGSEVVSYGSGSAITSNTDTVFVAKYKREIQITYRPISGWSGDGRYQTNTQYYISTSSGEITKPIFYLMSNGIFTKPNCAFSQWKDVDTGATYDTGSSLTLAPGVNDTKVNYVFEPTNIVDTVYTINFYDGTRLLGSQTCPVNQNVTLTAINSLGGLKTGFDFLGWKENDATSVDDQTKYGNQASVNNATNAGETLNLNAVYKRTLNFYSGSPSRNNPVTQYYNGGNYSDVTSTSNSITAISGMTTLGWRDDTTAGEKEYDQGAQIKGSSNNYYAVYNREVEFQSKDETQKSNICDAVLSVPEQSRLADMIITTKIGTNWKFYDNNYPDRGGSYHGATNSGNRYTVNGVLLGQDTIYASFEYGGRLYYTCVSVNGDNSTYRDADNSYIYYDNTYSSVTQYQYYNANGNYSVNTPNIENNLNGWNAIGWRVDQGAENYSVQPGAVSTSSSQKFYAVYSRTLYVDYNGNAGSGSMSPSSATQFYNAAGNISKPSISLAQNNFSRTGYTFDRWAEGSISGSRYWTGSNYTFAPSVNNTTIRKTFYATWNSVVKYQVIRDSYTTCRIKFDLPTGWKVVGHSSNTGWPSMSYFINNDDAYSINWVNSSTTSLSNVCVLDQNGWSKLKNLTTGSATGTTVYSATMHSSYNIIKCDMGGYTYYGKIDWSNATSDYKYVEFYLREKTGGAHIANSVHQNGWVDNLPSETEFGPFAIGDTYYFRAVDTTGKYYYISICVTDATNWTTSGSENNSGNGTNVEFIGSSSGSTVYESGEGLFCERTYAGSGQYKYELYGTDSISYDYISISETGDDWRNVIASHQGDGSSFIAGEKIFIRIEKNGSQGYYYNKYGVIMETGYVTLYNTLEEAGISFNISEATVTLNPTSYTYGGNPYTPSVTVTHEGRTLTNGTHYTVTYSNNTNAGTATCTITGIGNYKGTKNTTFTIAKRSINSDTALTLSNYSYVYDGQAKQPTVHFGFSANELIERKRLFYKLH